MGFHNIEKASFRYKTLKLFAGLWHNHVYYKKVVVEGRENIPENGHLIFTPNHQNALNDALAVLFAIRNQLVFLARSDIFKKDFIASILYFLKILPIYRIRDGYDTLKKNELIFKKTVDVINNHNGLVILPEGNHSGFKRLRPLKKGFARIAFQAEEANDFKLGIQVVPVGIEYEHYQNFRTTLFIQFGKPIAVADYVEEYQEDAAIAINHIKSDLSEAMKPLIINIEDKEHYELYSLLTEVLLESMVTLKPFKNNKQPHKIKAQQAIIEQLNNLQETDSKQFSEVMDKTASYKELLDKHQLMDSDMKKKPTGLFLLLLASLGRIWGFAAALPGILINLLPFQLSVRVSGKIKDPQFQSSIKYVVSLLIFPLTYLLFIAGVWIGLSWQAAIIFVASIPLLSLISWRYVKCYRSLVRNWQLHQLFKREITLFNKLSQLRSELLNTMESHFSR